MTRFLIIAGVGLALVFIVADCYLSYRRSHREALPYIVMSQDEFADAAHQEQHYQVQFQPDEIRAMLAMRRGYAKQHGSEVEA